MRRPLLTAATLAMLLALAACGRTGPDEAAMPSGHDPILRAQALIDSGNASYRAQDYATAAKRYAAAAVASPKDPATFYGLGMALTKLGRDDEAREAYAKARDLARAQGAEPDSVNPH